MSNLIGTIVDGRYAPTKVIGTGGGSTVYLSVDLRNQGKQVALKCVGGEQRPEILQTMFEREVTALRKLRHDHIVRILDHGTGVDVGSWIVLEYAPNGSLDQLEGRARFSTDAEISLLLRQCLEALGHAHINGVTHRDIKPSNILFGVEGEAMLADFNVSRVARAVRGSNATVRHHFTKPYAAPEQLAGKSASEKSDVFSLGLVIAELLDGEEWVEAEDLRRRLPTLNRSATLKQLVLRMLAENPDDRPTPAQLLPDVQALAVLSAALPVVHFRLSAKAQDSLITYHRHNGYTVRDARDEIRRDIGEPLRVSAERRGSPGREEYVVVGRRFRYFAIREQSAAREVMVIRGLAPTRPERREVQRAEALVVPVRAAMLLAGDPIPPNTSVAVFEDLFEMAVAERRTQIEAKRTKNELLRRWEAYVEMAKRLQTRDETIGEIAKAVYVEETHSYRLTLKAGLELSEALIDVAVSYGTPEGQSSPLGVIARVTAREVQVALPPNARLVTAPPPGSRLLLDRRREQASIERQQRALRAVRLNTAVKGDLAELLASPDMIDPPSARPFVPFTEGLDPENAGVVELALGTRALFLIQGPPGTGKTTVIAELVAQICRGEPNARVLIASQSHVAVDNVLERLHKLAPGISMLRLGSPANVGEAAKPFELSARLEQTAEELRRYLSGAKAALAGAMHAAPEELQIVTEELRTAVERSNDHAARAAVELGHELLGSGLPDEPVRLLRTLDALARIGSGDSARLQRASELQAKWSERISGRGYLDLSAHLLRSARVVAGTCVGFVSNRAAAALEYDWVIVDEAGRATAPELLVPITRGHKLVLVGDHKQLPPILDSEVAAAAVREAGLDITLLEKSLFEELYESVAEGVRVSLVRQYRMHPEIGDLVAASFYPDGLEHGVSAEARSEGADLLGYTLRWLDTSSAPYAAERAALPSFQNPLEVQVIVQDLARLRVAVADQGKGRKRVGVLTAYAAQEELLQRELTAAGAREWPELDVQVITVDASQGREYDIVYYSAVRSNPQRKVGFLADARRLNVALSRAREALTIVGNAQHLRTAISRNGPNPFPSVLGFFAQNPQMRPMLTAGHA